jgi:hypothetical protein
MFKRIFWLAVVVAAGWVIWLRLRQRQDQLAAYTPQFAQPFTPPPAAPQPPVAAQPSDRVPSADAATTTLAPAPTAPAAGDEQPEQSPATPSEAASAPADELGEVVGYCVRCKTKRAISDAHEETTESGRRAARGTCPVCGANMFTFLATNDEEPAAKHQE